MSIENSVSIVSVKVSGTEIRTSTTMVFPVVYDKALWPFTHDAGVCGAANPPQRSPQ